MNFMTPQERIELAERVKSDMIDLIINDEKFRESMKSGTVNDVYDQLKHIFFDEREKCIYDERFPYYAFHRRNNQRIKAKIRYEQNKMLGCKTQYPADYCIGLVLGIDRIEMVPDPERLTYNQAIRKIHKLIRTSEYPSWLMSWNIYHIEEDGTLTIV